MIRDMEGEMLKKRAERSLSMTDIEVLVEARNIFSKRKYISTAYLQMVLQIPFMRASNILEALISEGFAKPKYNSFPRGISFITHYKKS